MKQKLQCRFLFHGSRPREIEDEGEKKEREKGKKKQYRIVAKVDVADPIYGYTCR